MKIDLELSFDGILGLPLDYNIFVQSFIYSNIDANLASYLHDHGFVYGKSVFKLFAFSRIIGKYELNKTQKTITFQSPIHIYFTTPLDYFANSLVNTMLHNNDLHLARKQVEIAALYADKNQVALPSDQVRAQVKPGSIVTAYKTVLLPDGKRRTEYRFPRDEDYDDLMMNNLLKKAGALGLHVPNPKLAITTRRPPKMRIVFYKGFSIKGHEEMMTITGSRELINIALAAGLGSKNSQGFGMLELLQAQEVV